MLTVISLNGILSKKLFRSGESIEQLIVEIIAVSNYNDSRIFHFRGSNKFTGIEDHTKAFARALSMPDNATAFIAMVTGGFYTRYNRFIYRIVLMIGSENLFSVYEVYAGFCIFFFCFLKYNKTTDNIKQSSGV